MTSIAPPNNMTSTTTSSTSTSTNIIKKHQIKVFILTYICYGLFSSSRLSYSVTKPILEDEWPPFTNKEYGTTYLGILDSIFLTSYAIGLVCNGRLGDKINLRYFITFGLSISGIILMLYGCADLLNIHHLAYFIILNIFSGFIQSIGWPICVTILSNWLPKHVLGLWFGIWCSQASFFMFIYRFIDALIIKYLTWGSVFIISGLINVCFAFILFF